MDFVFQRTYYGNLKAVILDWAGTIVDYGCFAPAVVFTEVFKHRGIEIQIDQARLPMGMNKRDHIEAILKMEPVVKDWLSVFGCPYTESDIDELYAEFIPLQLSVLPEYADLIPGTLEVIAEFRKRGLKIGTSTGYNAEMLDILLQETSKKGFTPDSSVSSSDVPAGRPEPWMCLLNAMQLRTYPMESIVKIGDTVPDIEEGLNAGIWTIGVVMTGNEIGLTEAQINQMNKFHLDQLKKKAYAKMYHAGAHYVVDSIRDVPEILLKIEKRLQNGDRP